jgi:hypothetical protein
LIEVPSSPFEHQVELNLHEFIASVLPLRHILNLQPWLLPPNVYPSGSISSDARDDNFLSLTSISTVG